LAAGVILALSASVLGLGVRQSLRSLYKARDYQQASELLDTVLTKIDLFGPGTVEAEGPWMGQGTPPFERFGWQANIELLDSETWLYEVTVWITWADAGGRKQSVEAQTLLYDPPRQGRSAAAWEDV
jgi:hypothetical protein